MKVNAPPLNGRNASRGQSLSKKREGLNWWGSFQYRAAVVKILLVFLNDCYVYGKLTIIMKCRGTDVNICVLWYWDGNWFAHCILRCKRCIFCGHFGNPSHLKNIVMNWAPKKTRIWSGRLQVDTSAKSRRKHWKLFSTITSPSKVNNVTHWSRSVVAFAHMSEIQAIRCCRITRHRKKDHTGSSPSGIIFLICW
jgi:hypothetical protein